MPKKSPYEILGICQDATEGEAKRNFRVLAKQYHPDRNPGDKEAETRFKEIHDAWDAVKNILPKSVIPFPDIDPDDPVFEDAIVEWMMAMDAATAPKAAPGKRRKSASQDPGVWTTVAADLSTNTGMAISLGGALVDWRHQTMKR